MRRSSILSSLILMGVSFMVGTNLCAEPLAREEAMLEEIVVTSTKTEQEIKKTGSSVTVITKEDIAESGYKTVEEALRNVPGLTVVSSGPFGAATDVSIRGSKNYGHTLVLVDGMIVNDPISIQRSFDFAHMQLDNIERIEIVRGPQSTLYGSDAMAGVINIITKKGQKENLADFSLWGGQYNTIGGNIGMSGAIDKFNYSFSLSMMDTDGISKAYGGTEDDAFSNIGFSTRLGYEILDNAEVSVIFRYSDSKTDLDDDAFIDNPNFTSTWKNLSAKAEFKHAVSSYWDHQLSFAYTETERGYKDILSGTDNSYTGNLRKLEWQNNLYPFNNHIITAGFEYLEEAGSSKGIWGGWPVDFPEKTTSNTSFYLQDQINIANSLFITPGLRIDDNEMFGNETTYRFAAVYVIDNTGTRLKGTYGTGFKAPTLFQLYDGFSGNADLKPERNTGYDFGFEQHFIDGKFSFGATYFSNSYENMIDWDSGKYNNIGRVETSGFEVETAFRPIQQLQFKLNYTYLDTKDKQTDKELLRRPHHQLGFNTHWQITSKADLNLKLRYTSERKDLYYQGWIPVEVENDAYVKVDLLNSYKLSDNLSLFVKIENLFDKNYQEIVGYSMPGRSFYGGIKGRF